MPLIHSVRDGGLLSQSARDTWVVVAALEETIIALEPGRFAFSIELPRWAISLPLGVGTQDGEIGAIAANATLKSLVKLGRNMVEIKKQIITNEAMEPVGVIISYQDWQKIEALLENQMPTDDRQDLMAFAGTIQLTIDPLDYQRQERDAWQ